MKSYDNADKGKRVLESLLIPVQIRRIYEISLVLSKLARNLLDKK